ncbi:proline-rich protein 5-like [Hippoglossus hippoglossus]|uniref:proline-rich protein 5-like n=1 Tax=Hippoglossus hippoglossus TaxID=8267 RepID=UPI00148E0562|nr:proline-rich protein 5-like [Hippoglossus hippoglossus]XP_034444159.1 proline-rich protein 5-like [Hippoglossus hippoglossus]XP_047196008.1 proline-rich protein 5-like [Hippoglossus stenolepis]XP_047196009.1 proline-rich protein 5-like [Hippoglossus stenolepis]XP_047196010.1 proline-rich protein 5-like [Hippoglossus stenolepis]XP_047196011.1 proline-rich protein 5-like [Hippoglossus stenolepis]
MMGSFRRPRPRFMSSPVLSDLARFHASSSALHISNTSVWNSVQSAVIKVFQGGALQTNELYTLNESIRWLLKTEMGSFITEYFQNQLLTRGLSDVLDQILLHSGDERLVALGNAWDRFFTETLPTLQAIFYPVQGQELTVRQMVLLAFRDLVLLKLHLEETLGTAASIPPPVTQMLLVLQGIHESGAPSLEYYQLERLVEVVVCPYVSNVLHNTNHLLLESRHLRLSGSLLGDQPEITISQHHSSSDSSSLAPLVEQEGEAYLEKVGGVRRHTVANAHSDVRLLSASGRIHAGTGRNNGVGGGAGGVRFLVGGGPMSPRPFSSQPDMVESPRGGVICLPDS